MHRSIYAYKHKTQKFTHIPLHTNIHIHIHAHPTLVHTQAHTSMYTYSYAQAHTFKHTYKHALINTYIHLQTHICLTHTYTYLCTDIPAYACSLLNLVHTHTFANMCKYTCKHLYTCIHEKTCYTFTPVQMHGYICTFYLGSSIKTSKEIWSRYKNCMATT